MALRQTNRLRRDQLATIQGLSEQGIRTFEALFNSLLFLAPGDVIYAAATTRAGALPADGTAVSRTLYADLFARMAPSSVVAISLASPGVVTWPSHGRKAGEKIQFVTNGALPSPLVAGAVYFVKTVLDADTFTISATLGGSAIPTTTAGSGTHTATAFPYGIGDGSTTFEVPNVPAVGGCNAFIIY